MGAGLVFQNFKNQPAVRFARLCLSKMAIFIKPKEYRFYSQQNYLHISELISRIAYYLMFVGLLLIPIIVIAAIMKEFSEYGVISFLFIFMFAPVYFIYYKLAKKFNKERKSYNKGRWGEKFLKGKLSELSDDFYVIPGLFINRKRANIDFIVMGPTGIFAIETKESYWLEKNKFNKARNRIARDARFLREDILEHLKKDNNFYVRPVLVIAERRPGISMYNWTAVMNRNEVVEYVENYKNKLPVKFLEEVKIELENFLNT